MPLKNYHKTIAETPDDIKNYVRDSMHILERLNELLDKKFDGKQKLLAQKMGKSEAEISKMLNGVQNFTLRTLSKLSAAFDEPIIAICTEHEHANFEQVKIAGPDVKLCMHVEHDGEIKEQNYVSSHSLSNQPSEGKKEFA